MTSASDARRNVPMRAVIVTANAMRRETETQPWAAAGVSRATWFRRKGRDGLAPLAFLCREPTSNAKHRLCGPLRACRRCDVAAVECIGRFMCRQAGELGEQIGRASC